MELNERIRKARSAIGKTQQDLADFFGISRPTVTQWELGTHRPDQDKLPKLALFLAVTLDWLMEEEGPGPGDIPAAPKPVETAKFLKTSKRKFYVREWREHLKERVENAAKAAGMPINEYEAFETHPINFTLAQLEAIADEIGVAGHQFWFPPPRLKHETPVNPSPSSPSPRILRRNGKRL